MLPTTPLSRICISIRRICNNLPQEKIPARRAAAVAIVLSVVLLAGSAMTGSTRRVVLYRFHGGADGAGPGSGLVADKTGILYGTTGHGGGSSACFEGCGTVFQLVPPAQPGGTWTHNVLYSFTGSDAIDPYTALVLDQAGNLYGTAPTINNGGVLYQLAPPAVPGGAWTETVLHTFVVDSGDGWNPVGKLVFDRAGNLYGATTYGGRFDAGIVYELSPPAQVGGHWTETLLHDFTGGADGANPGAGFIFDGRGNLYGTASAGGTGPCNDGQGGTGCGVVFALKPPAQTGGPWTETVLYNFQGGSDEASPASELIFDRQGNLYGTSILTVYEITPPAMPPGPWTETTLYSFPGGITGTNPSGAVIFDKAGNLYGNAVSFGIEGNSWVYTLAPPAVQGGSWTETTLFNFPGGLSSASPYGALISGKDGALYGTTSAGGVSNQGTVFSFVP